MCFRNTRRPSDPPRRVAVAPAFAVLDVRRRPSSALAGRSAPASGPCLADASFRRRDLELGVVEPVERPGDVGHSTDEERPRRLHRNLPHVGARPLALAPREHEAADERVARP